MNKVTCNLCGTSYPENAAQCPICGEVRSADSASERSSSGTYTYVKGGRFSKANVKKRNRASGTSAEPIIIDNSSKNAKKKSRGLIAVIIVLLLAIIAVLGYIAFQLFVPAYLFDSLINGTTFIQRNEDTQPNTQPAITEQAETEPDLTCKKITLSQTQIQAEAIGQAIKLTATPEPADTTDEMLFSSSDISVATVLSDGTITFTGEGSAVITVSCGSVSVDCFVTCAVPTDAPITESTETTIELNRKEITFNQEGQTWLLYSGEIPVSEILWTSDDNDVATIADGKVTAVGNGDTMVYGIYGEEAVSCIIHCDFNDLGDSGGITEAGGESGTDDTTEEGYSLYNPYGYADDVTLFVGDQFTLQLVDSNGNEVTDAQWRSTDESICTYADGTVEAVGIGTAEIIATCNGVDYICTVRIIEP